MSLPANFPSSADALSNPTATTNRDDPGFELDLVIARIHDILEALEAKVGVGASLPTSAGVLRRTAPGVTGWGQVAAGDYGPGSIAAGDLAAGIGVVRLAIVGPLVGSQASIDFTSIPQTYTNLRILILGRSTVAATSDPVNLTMNGVTTASYYGEAMLATAASVSAAEALATTSITPVVVSGASSTAGLSGAWTIDLPGYAGPTLGKAVTITGGALLSTTSGNVVARTAFGHLNTGSGITSIKLQPAGGSWAVGTVCALYGF